MVITRKRIYKSPIEPRKDANHKASSNVAAGKRTDRPQKQKGIKIRAKIDSHHAYTVPTPCGFPFRLDEPIFGLMQERIRTSLYALVVQAILWNQTHGLAARPVFFQLLTAYPTPLALSEAAVAALTQILQPIGLQNRRAARLIALAKVWVLAPPCKEKRYRRLHYPLRGDGMDVRPWEVLSLDDEREGWEIAHLPGVGPYALDSFRIFFRDELRAVDHKGGNFESEWKKVLPQDKDLRAYLIWRWETEGWRWNMYTGERTKLEKRE